ncbi:lymphatic vessel endothelial hyaluronic acid receptor 1a [Phycodurus eques]|uniref:lymphatic vessel endothelial hyaluronic acid receptor 1a n=1 Tax=Phycodurus eques TaxID=693459 RepID=UPI002ACEE7D1|nr:lymphatic vessel endothelial hyaluronic acid receptor 1a [Phycodurus eques]
MFYPLHWRASLSALRPDFPLPLPFRSGNGQRVADGPTRADRRYLTPSNWRGRAQSARHSVRIHFSPPPEAMKSIFLFAAAALSVAAVVSQRNVTMNLQVFPAKSVAGVIQISLVNDKKQPVYGFDITEARNLCAHLGLDLASKDQVTEAHNRGLETCRFGWIDEHFAVIPRVRALLNCGQNRTGLVPWRAALDKKFDVFCFNQSDYTAEEETTTPVSSDSLSPTPALFVLDLSSTSDLSLLDSLERAQLARLSGGDQSSGRGKAILITSACAVLLAAVAVLAYVKVKRRLHRADAAQERGEVVESSS